MANEATATDQYVRREIENSECVMMSKALLTQKLLKH